MYEPIYRAKPSNLVKCAFGLPSSLRWPPFATVTPLGQLVNLRRLFTSTSQKMLVSSPRLQPVSGDGAEIIFSQKQPVELPERLSRLSAWNLSASRMGITRQYIFPTFAAAWRFMSLVADECKARRHHPAWANLYNEVTIEWTTHNPKGLSIKDVEMAEFCDRTAKEIGLKVQE
jgi:pterin-4a-carbinolamine dehydratase